MPPRTVPADAADATVHQARLRVMGSSALVTVVGGRPAHLHLAAERLRRLDHLWSRFRPDSDLSRLNMAEGAAVPVAPETLILMDHLVAAWHATGGAFDPTLLPAQVAAGDAVSRDDPFARTVLPASAAWPGDPAHIVTDHAAGLARLPRGTAVDAGGLGKGLAADLTVADIIAAGAAGALVSVGGDVSVDGRAPHGAWSIAVEDPHEPAGAGPVLALAAGGVATSTPAARRWRAGGVEHHHLLSPDTGEPAQAPIASVTVATGTATWAEAFTKVPFVRGPRAGIAILEDMGVATLVVTSDRSTEATTAWSRLAQGGRATT
jgi:thiamine biosynthesis lipoprotein